MGPAGLRSRGRTKPPQFRHILPTWGAVRDHSCLLAVIRDTYWDLVTGASTASGGSGLGWEVGGCMPHPPHLFPRTWGRHAQPYKAWICFGPHTRIPLRGLSCTGAIVCLRGGALSCFQSSWTYFVFNFSLKRDVKNLNELCEEELAEALGRLVGRPPLHVAVLGLPTTARQPGRGPRPGPAQHPPAPHPPPPLQPDAESGREWPWPQSPTCQRAPGRGSLSGSGTCRSGL